MMQIWLQGYTKIVNGRFPVWKGLLFFVTADIGQANWPWFAIQVDGYACIDTFIDSRRIVGKPEIE